MSGTGGPAPRRSAEGATQGPSGQSSDDVSTFLSELAEALATRSRREGSLPGFRPAAVLVPLVCRTGALCVTFLRRVEDGSIHSGQVAFPGGAREEEDADTVANAVREAEEEVGIPAATVRFLGLLDDSATISHYVVTPVVGVVEPPPEYRLDPREAQEVFEVPLTYLLDRDHEKRVDDVEFLGHRWPLFEYRWQERLIWGATGRMLHEFLEIARALPAARALSAAAPDTCGCSAPVEVP